MPEANVTTIRGKMKTRWMEVSYIPGSGQEFVVTLGEAFRVSDALHKSPERVNMKSSNVSLTVN